MTLSLLMVAALTTAAHVLVVIGRSAAGESVQVPDDEFIMPAVDSAGRCYVVTIFGLKTADCGKQSARTVPTSLDSDLQVLRFEDNRLTVLGDGEFSSYANLQEIYLARNRLELMEETALRGLYSLQILDLEANQLTAVPAKSLRAVATSLRLLSLKNNPIRRLEADALSSLTRLEEINLEDCWLEYLDPLAFSGLDRLSAVNLVNNELRAVDAAMQSTLPSSLRVVRLYRNPWTCDCRLRWLRRWLVSGDVRRSTAADDHVDATINWDFASNTPTCAAPALIRGVAWRHLTADQFACPSRIVAVSAAGTTGNSTTTGLRATAGSNASVECVAAGDPEPIISWSRGERGGSQVLAPPKALISVRQGSAGADGEPRIVSVLILVRVTATTDSGDYTCMAENTAGRAEMTFTLTVDKAPVLGASGGDLWPIDRDAFLGVLIGLLVIACVIVVCTVFRLCSIARRRQRRMHNKNVYYLADTGNHVAPSPLSNHLPQGDVESVVNQTAVDDEDAKSSDESTPTKSYLGDGKLVSGSAGHHLLPNHDHLRTERADRHGRHGRKTHAEAEPRLHNEARGLLSPDAGTDLADLGETNMDDGDHRSVSDKISDDASTYDTDELRTNGQDATNHRERPSRAVSFGPDMIIDARRSNSSSVDRPPSPAPCDNLLQDNYDDVVDRQSEQSGSRSQQEDDEPVFQRMNPSPSVARRPPLSHPAPVADRRTPTPAVVDGHRSAVDNSVLGVGRRHSGDVRLVGNGSVRRGQPSYQLGRPLSPQTPTPSPPFTHRPASESGSLERPGKTRRRLPILTGAAGRRPPSPGMRSSPAVKSPSPGMRSPSPAVRSPSPGMSGGVGQGSCTAVVGRSPSPRLRSSSTGMRSPSLSIKSPSLGMRSPSPSVTSPSPGMSGGVGQGSRAAVAGRAPSPALRYSSTGMRSPNSGMSSPNPGTKSPSPSMRSPSPGMLGGVGRSGRRRDTTASPHQQVSSAHQVLPGNHVGDWKTPVSLAELLAPPFGSSGARNSRSTGASVTQPSQRFSPTVNTVFDDDSGTDI